MALSRRRKLSLLVSAGFGIAVAVAALVLMPPSHHEVGPATLTAKTHPGSPHTVLAFPPLGTVRARTHPVPVSVQLSLAELNISALQEIIQSPTLQVEARAEIESGLRDAARVVALRSIVIGLVAGAIAGAVLPWRRWPDVIAGAAGGTLLAVVTVGTVGLSFDLDGFEEPTFSGALTRAPAVLETFQRREFSLADVDSRFETAAERLSELLELAASPTANPREDTIALLHVSDIHSNPLGISIVRQLAAQFDVDAVIDSGDLTSFGEAIEANVARDVARMNVPYIYVPGNHDSLSNQQRLDDIDNVQLLHDESVDIEGINIFGWRDPTYTVWDSISTEEANEIRTEEGETIAAALADEGVVDVLVVHDRRMAEAAEGLVPLVLSGHTHERETTDGDETDFLTVGSTGATGLSFFVETERAYEAEIVYFRDGTPIAVDYITFEALGEEFEIDRQRLND
jgi:predicted phosphodiesterase